MKNDMTAKPGSSETVKAFTSSQREILNCRADKVAVTASAGTGKTTVMVELIARLIEEGQIKLDNIAVVTFTESAAAQMRQRLGDALKKSLSPEAKRQLQDIDNCDISTIHAFCSRLLRNYFYAAGLSPNFGILEGGRRKTVEAQAMEELMEECYKENNSRFSQLVDVFSTNRTDNSLRKEILSCHEFAACQADFRDWYFNLKTDYFKTLNSLVCGLFEQSFGEIREVQSFARHIRADKAGNYCDDLLNWVVVKESNSFEENYGILLNAPSRPQLRGNIVDFPDNIEPGEWEEFTFKLKTASDRLGKLVKDWKNMFGGEAAGKLREQAEESKKLADEIVSLTLRFKEKFDKLKAKLNVIDFADMEHKTLKLLNDPQIAQEITQDLKMMFVDEYQDVNDVQEKLISVLSGKGKLFVVGDIKQAIYGFRQCDATIFSNRIEKYMQDGFGRVLHMNDNWRSHRDIVSFVNHVFCANMTSRFGGTDYALQPLVGSLEEKAAFPAVKVCLLTLEEKTVSCAESVYEIAPIISAGKKNAQREAQLIAKYIKEIVGTKIVCGEKAKTLGYGDVIILTRKSKEFAEEVCQTLQKLGIPVITQFNKDNNKLREILQLISLLKVLNNPYDDISMYDYLTGWFGGLSVEEVAQIRLGKTDKSLYETVKEFAADVSFELVAAAETPAVRSLQKTDADSLRQKATDSLDKLKKWRLLSYGCKVDELLKKIIRATDYGLYLSGQPNGELRNLRLGSFLASLKNVPQGESLTKFLGYYSENGMDEFTNPDYSDSGIVTMMTMHHSKGLEFPVVFICGAGEKLRVPEKFKLALNKHTGAGMKFHDKENRTAKTSVPLEAVKLQSKAKALEEELRLLYVALTRAKNHLIITGHVEKGEDKLTTPPQTAETCMQWLINARRENEDWEVFGSLPEMDELTQAKQIIVPPPSQDEKEKKLQELGWQYPYRAESDLPAKVVCSQLDRQSNVDEKEEEDEKVGYINETESNRLNVGTAYHKVFEQIQLHNPSLENINQILSGLKSKSIEEAEAFSSVSAHKVFNCVSNPRFQALISNAKIYRELPFILSANYAELVPNSGLDGETTLQGVIDLIAIKDNQAVIVDFKFTTMLEKIKEHYALQLNAYAVAVRRLLKIEKVTTLVFSVIDGRLYEF